MTTANVTIQTKAGQTVDMNDLISSTFGFPPLAVTGDENARLIKVAAKDFIKVIGTGLTYNGTTPSGGQITQILLVSEVNGVLQTRATLTLSGGTWNFA